MSDASPVCPDYLSVPVSRILRNSLLGLEVHKDQAVTLTETFLRMGLDELSVNPGSVLTLRKTIRSLDLSK